MRHLARSLRRGAVAALLAVTASCGGAAPDAGSTATATTAPAPEIRADLVGLAFDVKRDPG